LRRTRSVDSRRGKEERFDRVDTSLCELNLDAGFIVLDERPKFSLSGVDRRITLEFLENYGYAQVFAPKGKDFVALEPMTARTSALTSGQGLRVTEPGEDFNAAFRIGIQA
jgi:aldose 1-epimerase